MNLQDLRRDAAHSGWIWALLARGLWRAQIWLGMQVFRVNLRHMRADAPDRAPPEGIRLCVMRLEELLEAAADSEFDFDPAFARAALARGDVVFGAYEGERLVSLTWRTPVAAPLAEPVWTRVGPRCHHAYKSYVRPSHRGRHIHTAVSRFADRHSIEKGCPAEIGLVNVANLASVAAARSIGRPKVGYAGYITLFGRCILFRTPGVKGIGVELFRAPERSSNIVLARDWLQARRRKAKAGMEGTHPTRPSVHHLP